MMNQEDLSNYILIIYSLFESNKNFSIIIQVFT